MFALEHVKQNSLVQPIRWLGFAGSALLGELLFS
jgi:hypothetical protein